jgi:hypothetical protein
MAESLIEQLTKDFKVETLVSYFSVNCPKFRSLRQDLSEFAPEDSSIEEITQIGTVEYNNASRIIFIAHKEAINNHRHLYRS